MSNLMTTPLKSQAHLSEPETRRTLEGILNWQRSGTLATSFMDIPLCSQMAFAADADLRNLIIVTPRQTTKYDNMSANPNVSFLISTAVNSPTDPATARAVRATAFATELDGERRHLAVNLFIARHPDLAGFASDQSSAVMELKVDGYDLIDNFQHVTHISLG